ncbi:MAG TPA: IS4 family transposase [Herpetosiphonaceae bacterium]|nr:IS4 family transposase [Herpetosiphonaceae bacterium]
MLQLYPSSLSARQTRHLVTLAALISGIVASRQTQLPAIASKLPDPSTRESRVKRFQRWLTNPGVTPERYFLPFAAMLIQSLAHVPLALVMDGSTVGRGCLALVVSLVYHGRTLPIAWLVVAQRKGHVDVATHLALLREVHALVPAETTVVFLGDGEFDGPELQAELTRLGWSYVCRTAKNIQIQSEGEWLTLGDMYVAPGQWLGLPGVRMTAQAYGPVLVIVWWGREHREPLYLVTNLDLVAEACWWYRKRFRIETFFSDQKGRGFHLHQSHLSDPARLTRLLLAACLAYLWIIYLGALVRCDDWLRQIHRTDRCDLSLFQLGFVLLDHLLNEGLAIPVSFRPPEVAPIESVR